MGICLWRGGGGGRRGRVPVPAGGQLGIEPWVPASSSPTAIRKPSTSSSKLKRAFIPGPEIRRCPPGSICCRCHPTARNSTRGKGCGIRCRTSPATATFPVSTNWSRPGPRPCARLGKPPRAPCPSFTTGSTLKQTLRPDTRYRLLIGNGIRASSRRLLHLGFFPARENGLKRWHLFIAGRTIRKVIVVPKQLVNLVAGQVWVILRQRLAVLSRSSFLMLTFLKRHVGSSFFSSGSSTMLIPLMSL